MNKVVNNESNNKINSTISLNVCGKIIEITDKSSGHETNIIKPSELLIMDKTIWCNGIFEPFSLCSK